MGLLVGLASSGAVRSSPIDLGWGLQNRASYLTDYTVTCTDQSGSCGTVQGTGNVTPTVLDVSTTSKAEVAASGIQQGDPAFFFIGTSNTLVNFDSYAQTDVVDSTIKKNRVFASASGTIAPPWSDSSTVPGNDYEGTPRAFTQARSTWYDDLLFDNTALNGTPGSAVFHFVLSGDAPVGGYPEGGFYIFYVCSDSVSAPAPLPSTDFCGGFQTKQVLKTASRNGNGSAFTDSIDVTLDFTYGDAIRMIVDLQAALQDAIGVNDMFNSADLMSVAVAPGTTILDGTGTGFQTVSVGADAPGSLALLVPGLLGLIHFRRRSRQASGRTGPANRS